MFSSLKGWGGIALILGAIQILAGMSLFSGGMFGIWFGLAAASLTAIDALLDIPAYPLWSVAMFGAQRLDHLRLGGIRRVGAACARVNGVDRGVHARIDPL